jgi:FMN reductase
MLKVTVVVGNPKPKSRTAQIATRVVEILCTADTYSMALIDLADHTDEIFAWPSEKMTRLNTRVAESDLVIIASPTYKGTYTGLLKAFLDRYANLGLSGVVAVPVMTGADTRHALAPEVSLRPLLVELGAVVPTQGLYFVMDQIDEIDEVVSTWAGECAQRIAVHLKTVLNAINTSPATSASEVAS